MGCQEIKSGDASIVVAGGQESMSQSPHFVNMRNGVKFGDASLKDTMLCDGLTDAFDNIHMGVTGGLHFTRLHDVGDIIPMTHDLFPMCTTAENVAKEYKVSRAAQDGFALESQQKYREADEAGHFDQEIVSVSVPGRKGSTLVSKDENPRKDTTLEGLAALRPAFAKARKIWPQNISPLHHFQWQLIQF